MACCQTASSNNMNIVVNGLTSNLLRCLEQTADIDIETKVSKSASNNFGTTIVTILAHLGNKDSWVTTFLL